MEQSLGEKILNNKLRTVRKKLLDNLWNLIALLQNSDDHLSLLMQYKLQVKLLRKDLRSWPTEHKMKMAIRRLEDILKIVDNVSDQLKIPGKDRGPPMYAVMDIKIKIKARYIK